MRIALIGSNGQLGSDLQRVLQGDVACLTHKDIEITSDESINHALQAITPDVVINTAAYNLVDLAEDEPEAAFRVNALGPRLLAKWCQQHQVKLVHFSTDYVFGQNAEQRDPLSETDLPGPVSSYGLSKLAGEHFASMECENSVIIRTCGLYGQVTHGKGNFVQTMLRLGRDRDELKVVNDQTCTPTSTADLALATSKLLESKQIGLFHVTNSGQTTWCEFAQEIFRIAGLNVHVTPISSVEFGAKARRPAYSVLNCTKLEEATSWKMPAWQDALATYLAND